MSSSRETSDPGVSTQVNAGIILMIYLFFNSFPDAFGYLPVGRVAGTMLCMVYLIVFGWTSPEEAWTAVDWDVLLFLGAMMIFQVLFQDHGGVRLLRKLLRSSKSIETKVLIVAVVTSGLAIVLTNDGTCVFLAPAVSKITDSPTEQFQLLLAVATSANIASAAVLTGNPQNVLAAQFGGISYLRFAAILAPAAFFGLLLNMIFFGFYHGADVFSIVGHIFLGSSGNERSEASGSEDEAMHHWKGIQESGSKNSGGSESDSVSEFSSSMDYQDYSDDDSRSTEDKFHADSSKNLARFSGRKHREDSKKSWRRKVHEIARSETSYSSNGRESPGSSSISRSEDEHGEEEGGDMSNLEASQVDGDSYEDGNDFSQSDSEARKEVDEESGPTETLQRSRSSQRRNRPGLILHDLLESISPGLWLASGGVVLTVVAYLGLWWLPVGWSSMMIALVTVCLDAIMRRYGLVAARNHRIQPTWIFRRVDWNVLVWFISTFVIMHEVSRSNIVSQFLSLGVEAGQPLEWPSWPFFRFLIVVMLLSNVVSNVPLILLVAPFVNALSNSADVWLLLAWVTTIAGNLTLNGSAANIIVAEHGPSLRFVPHLLFGFPTTLVIVTVGTFMILLFLDILGPTKHSQ